LGCGIASGLFADKAVEQKQGIIIRSVGRPRLKAIWKMEAHTKGGSRLTRRNAVKKKKKKREEGQRQLAWATRRF
jgi:hypothetical protein